MIRLGLLLLAGSQLAGCAAPLYEERNSNWNEQALRPPDLGDGPISIVSGEVGQEAIFASVDCAEGFICMNVVYEISPENVEFIAGERLPTEKIYSVQHGARSSRHRIWMVHAGSDGRTWVLGQGQYVGNYACFDVGQWQDLRERLVDAGQKFLSSVTCFPT